VHDACANAYVSGLYISRQGCATAQVVALVARLDTQLTAAALQDWATGEMAPYQASSVARADDTALHKFAKGLCCRRPVLHHVNLCGI
jgi:hypothetical protein